jgi:hypothetical protein
MISRFSKTILTIGTVALLGFGTASVAAQNSNANRKPAVKSEIKQSGSEAKHAGTSLGHEVKHGRVVRGGKKFGRHTGRSAKHLGKSTAAAAKKTGNVVKKAVKP